MTVAVTPPARKPSPKSASTLASRLIKLAEEGAQHHKDLVLSCSSWQMSEEINLMGTEESGEKSMTLIKEDAFPGFSRAAFLISNNETDLIN